MFSLSTSSLQPNLLVRGTSSITSYNTSSSSQVDRGPLRPGKKPLASDPWQVTPTPWQVTPAPWQVTPAPWQLGALAPLQ